MRIDEIRISKIAQKVSFAYYLTDVKDFLESTEPIPAFDERCQIGENLLFRVQRVLTNLIELSPSQTSNDSPEPYLDMTANLKKSAADQIINGDRVSECYEVFDTQSLSSASDDPWPSDFSNFSASQAKTQAIKWTQLDQRREPRKMTFGFGFTRSCYAGIVGNHMLVYNSEQDSRPHSVIPLLGYRGRPISGASDPQTSFEIFCPGDRTFQFVARTSRDMDEWIEALEKLQRALDPDRNSKKSQTFVEILDLKPNRYVGQPKPVTPPKVPSPPLLKSRRLPSPPRQLESSLGEDEDQGLYHRIEDIGTKRAYEEYENCGVTNGDGNSSNINGCKEDEQETYDDVGRESVESETYDDVVLAGINNVRHQFTHSDVGVIV